jgi:hypothetical protein
MALTGAPALHAQRCGVEAVVLEAQARVGGRVLTVRGGPLSAPVDLGASIITGVAADAGKGLRADPSAIVARSGLVASLAFARLLHALPKHAEENDITLACSTETPCVGDVCAERAVAELLSQRWWLLTGASTLCFWQ